VLVWTSRKEDGSRERLPEYAYSDSIPLTTLSCPAGINGEQKKHLPQAEKYEDNSGRKRREIALTAPRGVRVEHLCARASSGSSSRGCTPGEKPVAYSLSV